LRSSRAGVILRLFDPESMGGIGDFGARINAEIARTGLSDEEIGLKVHISLSYFYSGYFTIQKENWFEFLGFLQCMTTIFFSAEGMKYLN
jgi:hypothetical protein